MTYVIAACKDCVYFSDSTCKRSPGNVFTHRENWCGEFKPMQRLYDEYDSGTRVMPIVVWPTDEATDG